MKYFLISNVIQKIKDVPLKETHKADLSELILIFVPILVLFITLLMYSISVT